MARIGVALSGGVDSALSAYLLKQSGHEIVGLTLKLWRPASESGGDDSLVAAENTARRLGISHVIVDATAEFKRLVVEPFRREYLAGRTPSPCINCNARIKFGLLWETAKSLNLDALATGHYARVEQDADTGRFFISRPRDIKKDQSYFLFMLSQEQLSRLYLPLGEYTKEEVKKLARELEMPAASRSESQEICFVPDGDYARVVEELTDPLPDLSGPILDLTGKEWGRHRGYYRYTVGQRRGLNIAAGKPLYVAALDPERRAVIVGAKEDIYASTLLAERVNFMRAATLCETEAYVRIRSTHSPTLGRATINEAGLLTVYFHEPQSAVTPGQAVVLYDREGCILAGGWIKG